MKKDKKVTALNDTMQDEKGTALTAQNFDIEALAGDMGVELPDDFQGNLKPVMLKVPIAHSAGLFEFPDGSQENSIEGIVIAYSTPNAWWENEEDERPACSSLDGVRPDAGIESPVNTDCSSCEYNQFGSGENGKGKKCSNKVRIFLLIDGKEIPYMISLSAMSIKPWAEYITFLKDEKSRFFGVITKISLERREEGKYKFSVAHPGKISLFDYYENDVEKINAKIRQVLKLIEMDSKEMKETEITRDEATEIAEPF